MSPRARRAGPERVLAVLQRQPGRTISARDLMAAADISTLEGLRTCISAARRARGSQAERLESVRGVGYRWGRPQTVLIRENQLMLDLDAQTASVVGESVHLTPHQTSVLHALTMANGQMLRARDLQQQTGISSIAAVMIHVSALRKALRVLDTTTIVTVRGQGYRYVGPPVHVVTSHRRPGGSLHVDSTGQVLRDGEPLRLRRREQAILKLLLEHIGEPVAYTDLRAHGNIESVADLQHAISSLRAALRGSHLHIEHCGRGRNAYILRVGAR